jgi:hypothetical protein
VRVEIRVYTDNGEEFIVSRNQRVNPRTKKAEETPVETLKTAHADAVAWLRRPARQQHS